MDKVSRIAAVQWTAAIVLVIAAALVYGLPGIAREASQPSAHVAPDLLAPRAILFEGGRDTVVVFTDFACPYCRRLAEELSPTATTATVLLRFFPARGRSSVRAAALATCADDQSQLKPAHDLLFALDSVPEPRWFGERLPGIDVEELERCFGASETMSRMQREYDDAVAAGVTGTPTALIDGRLVLGTGPILSTLAR